MSLPSRERGLKCPTVENSMETDVVAPFAGAWIEISGYWIGNTSIGVAPFAGAWIEISVKAVNDYIESVAPFAGAWIEINLKHRKNRMERSLPSRERGLKSLHTSKCAPSKRVAPFAGAWIEILLSEGIALGFMCRSLRGSVD